MYREVTEFKDAVEEVEYKVAWKSHECKRAIKSYGPLNTFLVFAPHC
jgi:hypothetical protein